MAQRDIPEIGVDIYTPDFLTIAKGFGCAALRAESFEHLKAELETAHQRSGPTVIEVDQADIGTW